MSEGQPKVEAGVDQGDQVTFIVDAPCIVEVRLTRDKARGAMRQTVVLGDVVQDVLAQLRLVCRHALPPIWTSEVCSLTSEVSKAAAMVRRKPSSRETVGSQPRTARARLLSPTRCHVSPSR